MSDKEKKKKRTKGDKQREKMASELENLLGEFDSEEKTDTVPNGKNDSFPTVNSKGRATVETTGETTGDKSGKKTDDKSGNKYVLKKAFLTGKKSIFKTVHPTGGFAALKSGKSTSKTSGEDTGDTTRKQSRLTTERPDGRATDGKTGELTGDKYGEQSEEKSGVSGGQVSGFLTKLTFVDITGDISCDKTERWQEILQATAGKWTAPHGKQLHPGSDFNSRRFYMYPAEAANLNRMSKQLGIPIYKIVNGALAFFFKLLEKELELPYYPFKRNKESDGKLNALGVKREQKLIEGKSVSTEVHKDFVSKIDSLADKEGVKKSEVANWAINSVVSLIYSEDEIKKS